MIKSFRKNHIIKILVEFQERQTPIDFFLHQYFKSHHAIGSNDRKEIADFIYRFIRWQGVINYFSESTIESKVDWLIHHHPEEYLSDESIPLHVRLSFPKVYFEILKNSLSHQQLIEFCLVSNSKAPTTIRVNPSKISRDSLIEMLRQNFDVRSTATSPLGIEVIGKATLFQTEEFEKGYFEMQDEASQLVSLMVEAEPKDAVLDFCSGAGGKTLGFAHKLNGQGQIYIHDVREQALQEAKKRLNRAGIQNYQILRKETPYWGQKKHKMDWVLVDAPCSGSGTLRRNPDQKWKFSLQMVEELVHLQRTIFEEALTFLKPNGKIIYATCSVLKEENQDQIDFFCQRFHLKLVKPPFLSIPQEGKMDGFFAAIMEKR